MSNRKWKNEHTKGGHDCRPFIEPAEVHGDGDQTMVVWKCSECWRVFADNPNQLTLELEGCTDGR